MKLEIKAFNIIYEDWGENTEDFFVTCQVDIGFVNQVGAEIYNLDVISPERLKKLVSGSCIEIGRGYFITDDFNQTAIYNTIERLINIETTAEGDIFNNIGKYFRNHH